MERSLCRAIAVVSLALSTAVAAESVTGGRLAAPPNVLFLIADDASCHFGETYYSGH
ncbi:MAG: hypothetical protein ACKO4T_09085 [Planctomycetaceae bacterium]